MILERNVLHGIVRGGVIVPEKDVTLPEGAAVEIAIIPTNAETPSDAALQAELAAWERAGQDAWAMIDAWEQENRPAGDTDA